jgi:hypothetical protein
MDTLKSYLGNDGKSNDQQTTENKEEGGGFMDKINGMAGGGAQGEKNEDVLDKSTSHPISPSLHPEFFALQAIRDLLTRPSSHRLRTRESPRPGRPKQRVSSRAGQGRGDERLHSGQVQGLDWH